ncbi:MAG TPA: hypothetical protein VJT31_37225 [Rugosimonospora sp.]|nr:hypothetical protein [Rugosimonospora sp.]
MTTIDTKYEYDDRPHYACSSMHEHDDGCLPGPELGGTLPDDQASVATPEHLRVHGSETIRCKHCAGSGEVEAEGYLDLDDEHALLCEMAANTNALFDETDPVEQLILLGRITSFAGRLMWLTGCNLQEADEKQALAREIVHGKVEDGTLTRLPCGRVIETCGHVDTSVVHVDH